MAISAVNLLWLIELQDLQGMDTDCNDLSFGLEYGDSCISIGAIQRCNGITGQVWDWLRSPEDWPGQRLVCPRSVKPLSAHRVNQELGPFLGGHQPLSASSFNRRKPTKQMISTTVEATKATRPRYRVTGARSQIPPASAATPSRSFLIIFLAIENVQLPS